MRLYRSLFDRGLARIDAERAHRLGFLAVQAGGMLPGAWTMRRVTSRPVETMGLTFPHALGLAAGFDKNADGIGALGALGFGHVEVGTVTGQAQPGNPQPRLFRLVGDRAVVNRMGFNNAGAERVEHNVRTWRRLAETARAHGRDVPVLGINIGKTKVVPDDDQPAVLADYATSARLLAPYADYLVVNVSSPNTPGLRSLQAVERLQPLLEHVRAVADEATATRGVRVPLLVKIAPDLADDDVLAVADLAVAIGLDGIVATNTTIAREGLRTHPAEIAAVGAGGLSGPPLAARATEVVRLLRERVGPGPTLIGVGGITTVDDVRERLAAGADLVQAYTAFIYEGPLWPSRIVKGLG